ncbi:unnamed protein product [Sphenostylis stenocarpa]|uniref:Uncharacterized protein n=1 Tax=Sphenostylis stenocarpa TaxID=92480 RepID=A0AA86SKK8_9FABA|nr:unnamed protein product [Sphenostylis stenocarpa]
MSVDVGWRQANHGRKGDQGYSAGSSVIKVMILRPRPGRHSPPPPTPGYSPEPGPGRNNKSPPTPFNSLLHMESLNPSAASA